MCTVLCNSSLPGWSSTIPHMCHVVNPLHKYTLYDASWVVTVTVILRGAQPTYVISYLVLAYTRIDISKLSPTKISGASTGMRTAYMKGYTFPGRCKHLHIQKHQNKSTRCKMGFYQHTCILCMDMGLLLEYNLYLVIFV